MKWKDLSNAAKSILEQLFDHNDNPRKFTITIGEIFKIWDIEYDFTEDVWKEISKYHTEQEEKETVWNLTRDGYMVTFEGVSW